MLFSKNLYPMAITLAQSSNYDLTSIIEIYQKFGDHLYRYASSVTRPSGRRDRWASRSRCLCPQPPPPPPPRGRHVCSKGDYDGAMTQYLKTIGRLEPSYVIRKFLDAQRIRNLTSYLQEMHEQGVANADHTTLLLNCYTKLKDNERLDAFIKVGGAGTGAGAGTGVGAGTGTGTGAGMAR